MIVRQATEDLQVHEEFVRLYGVPSIDATTLSTTIKDLFARMNLCFVKLYGQRYDGASTMSDCKGGVAKWFLEVEPRAFFTQLLWPCSIPGCK